jgi:acyl carrier protein
MEYLGRIDHQVKIRGFRIELGEIENKLMEHPLVKDAVVVPKEDSQGSNYLCAYLVGEGGLTVTSLREYLSKDLPDYMIPSHFGLVQTFPLTPNGKVDRKALKEMQLTSALGKRIITPPSTPIEIEVSQIWEELLKVKDISIHDNFLELGGHSLLANRMVLRLNQTFNINLSLMDILTNGLTISEVVSLIEERIVEEASDEDIQSVLGMLDGLSDDEIKKLMEKIGD